MQEHHRGDQQRDNAGHVKDGFGGFGQRLDPKDLTRRLDSQALGRERCAEIGWAWLRGKARSLIATGFGGKEEKRGGLAPSPSASGCRLTRHVRTPPSMIFAAQEPCGEA